jgi:hypothetical protein
MQTSRYYEEFKIFRNISAEFLSDGSVGVMSVRCQLLLCFVVVISQTPQFYVEIRLISFVNFCRYLMGLWNVVIRAQVCVLPRPLPWLLPSRFIEFNTEVACIMTKLITQSCVTRQLKYLAATSLRFPLVDRAVLMYPVI